jgi:predicted phosphodiesterase
MLMTAVALISDVHSNVFALEAVLADIDKRRITRIVNLGDSLYGPMDIHGTYSLLRSRPMLHLRGNCDRLLLLPPTVSPSTMDRNRRELTAEERAWIEELPETAEEEGLFLCHGTPESDEIYLLDKLDQHGCHPRPLEELVSMTNGVVHPVIACGHSHRPAIVYLPNGKTVINAGSVGLPAYHDDLPIDHKMESGTPHANYTLAVHDPSGWRFEQFSIPYDWEAAASMADFNGRPDWAQSIRTGFA